MSLKRLDTAGSQPPTMPAAAKPSNRAPPSTGWWHSIDAVQSRADQFTAIAGLSGFALTAAAVSAPLGAAVTVVGDAVTITSAGVDVLQAARAALRGDGSGARQQLLHAGLRAVAGIPYLASLRRAAQVIDTATATARFERSGKQVAGQLVEHFGKPPDALLLTEQALKHQRAAMQALERSIADFGGLARRGLSEEDAGLVRFATEGVPLTGRFQLPPEKLAWIDEVIGQVRSATGLQGPGDLAFKYADAGPRLKTIATAQRAVSAMEFPRGDELAFAHEAIAHEFAHSAFRQLVLSESPILAELTHVAGGYQDLLRAYQQDALTLAPMMRVLEETTLGQYFVGNTSRIVAAHDELFADLAACLTRNDATAQATVLALKNAPDAELRSFAVTHAPSTNATLYTVFSPLRRTLWDYKEAWSHNPHEYMRRVGLALVRSAEFHVGQRTPVEDFFRSEESLEVLRRALELEFLRR